MLYFSSRISINMTGLYKNYIMFEFGGSLVECAYEYDVWDPINIDVNIHTAILYNICFPCNNRSGRYCSPFCLRLHAMHFLLKKSHIMFILLWTTIPSLSVELLNMPEIFNYSMNIHGFVSFVLPQKCCLELFTRDIFTENIYNSSSKYTSPWYSTRYLSTR